ncbi:MAG: TadE/TadG family type IV pilus assembly protein [Mesorhizobium sp.]
MRRHGSFRQAIDRFARHRGGNFAVVFGIAASALVVGIGLAVDTVQLMNAKSALRAAVDAAVTSTARSITLGDITEEAAPTTVRAFLSANSTGGLLSYDEIVLDRLTIDNTAKTVEAEAHVDVSLYFPLFGMPNTRRVSNTGAAIYSDRHIEVAMMLDLTTSMEKKGRTDKIGDLKDAASQAVKDFLDLNKASSPRVRVAIVPYADGVNTGPLSNTVFREARNSDGAADAPPPLTAATPVSTGGDACATERKNAAGNGIDYSDAGPYTAMVNRDDRLAGCPQAALMPLTTDKDGLLARIKAFKADGYTAGHIGVQWTRYMLSPSWRDRLEAAAPGSGPADYTDRKVKKIAILMTDGEFNTAFAGVARSERTQAGSTAATIGRAAAEEMCRRMKQDSIEIFTVGFMLDNADARAVMQNCASNDSNGIRHYYLAADGDALKAAFSDIARNAEQLALTK